MIRGVICPPATWIATNIDPKVKTIKDIVKVTTVSITPAAPASVVSSWGTHHDDVSIDDTM